MLTVSHIAYRLSTSNHPSTNLHRCPSVYCIYCGVQLDDISRGLPHLPLICPLSLHHYDGQEWRSCAECTNIASTLWYYHGAGQSYLPFPKMRGAALDVYVWILRENPQDTWTIVRMPQLATELRYSYGTIAAALLRLRKRGYLEKRPRMGRYGQYKPLIWQRPKGE